jgi:SAM-dependent methyltransferase
VCADVFAYEPPAPLDTIVASHFLEHVDEPVDLLRRFARWLAPGGRALLVVPNAGSLHRQIGRRMGLLRELTDLNDGDLRLGHKRVYTRAVLDAHLAASGLAVVHVAGATLKALSNAQLAALPRAYLDACIAMNGSDVGDYGCQIVAVLEKPAG